MKTFDVSFQPIYPDQSIQFGTPTKSTSASAAFDLRSNDPKTVIPPLFNAPLHPESGRPSNIAIIGTGYRVVMDKSICGLVMSRSGLSTKGIVVANAPGLIDPDYQDEIKVILINLGVKPFYVEPGDRIAQIFFTDVKDYNIMGADCMRRERTGGLGSTGVT